MDTTQTLAALSQGLQTKEFSSVELINATFDRIESVNTHNSFITLTKDHALAQAVSADRQISDGIAGPLTGLPIGQKDLFCTKGILTTCGSKSLENYIPPYNATTVESFNQAGMCMVGKLNMDEFAMGAANENSFFGDVTNPWDITRTPGGSSGGSAAAIAARLVPAVTGTDTGGSIRQPASFCGITGLKPTYGRVSRYGMIAFASSLDSGGPMAQTAEDCAMLFNAMAGFDPKDSTSARVKTVDYTANLNKPLKGLKVGIPTMFNHPEFSDKCKTVFKAAFKVYEDMGCELIDIDLPNADLGTAVYYILAPAEAASNLSRFDGVRYGHRCENPKDLADLYERSRSEGFGEEVKRRIMLGNYVLSSGYFDAYYRQAQKVRRLMANDFVEAFKKVDVIFSPTTAGTALKLGECKKDPARAYLADMFALPASLAGLPSVSVPSGFLFDRPLGMQIIGKHFCEADILNIAHQYQQATDWHKAKAQGV